MENITFTESEVRAMLVAAFTAGEELGQDNAKSIDWTSWPVTTRGMKEPEMAEIADLIGVILGDIKNLDAAKTVRQRVRRLVRTEKLASS